MTREQLFEQAYALELMNIAEQDMLAAHALGHVPKIRVENVFLLAQQALEKALKAVLCWHRKAIPFVYEIGILVTKLENIGLVPPFGYMLNSLSEYATIRRYLEGKESYTEEEITEILRQIQSALLWCRQQVAENNAEGP